MYLQHFSFNAKPFELLPDPGFLFPSTAHKKALAYLEYGLQEHSGFILLTGEVGAGKTTLIRSLLGKEPARTTIAKIFNTQVDTTQLIRMINDDFGLESKSNDKADLLRELNFFLIEQYAARRRSVLIVDEAQNLGLEQLEEIRLLSNLETAHAKLLQIVLVGQPELRDRLRSPNLVQLRQRILVHCHIPPLNVQETMDYILHRLELAGNRDALHWHEGSLEIIHSATRGVPRLINILCDYVLLDSFSSGVRQVAVTGLKSLLEQLDFEAQFWPEALPEQKPAEEQKENAEERAALQDRLDVLTAAVGGLARRVDECEGRIKNEAAQSAGDALQRLAELEKSVAGMAEAQKRLMRDIIGLNILLQGLLECRKGQSGGGAPLQPTKIPPHESARNMPGMPEGRRDKEVRGPVRLYSKVIS